MSGLLKFLIVVSTSVWVAGFVWFVTQINFYKRVDSVEISDAIVVLTGSTKRIRVGLDLLERNLAPRVFISGVNQNIDVQQILQLVERNYLAPKGRIELGYVASNTRENAVETVAWMHRHEYQSLRLVTSHYHMPRSILEFEHLKPKFKIIPHSVTPKVFLKRHGESWFDKIWMMLEEYHKWAFVLLEQTIVKWGSKL